ncbi:helicase associated domain-containing protein [Arthrobacter sp. SLBN-122]|uniref:helicase associated domain-containing protein n=1 Tax=Arthrobacter sp. SLBN-122 TaxID=2768455 RepID=UPI001150D5C4|nr:helicase associated domain-containing protein [Arthrobacter sp. SLBN-122]TQJ36731.1 hypothetical protein FBY36_4037 [Arthrobacter sp. SLBN-122]
MALAKRPAPNPEWVEMYRSGIPVTRISVVTGVARSVIRYHLAKAAEQDGGLRVAHSAAAVPPSTRPTVAGRRNLEDVLAFYKGEGRRPFHRRSARESALAAWLVRRREETAAGSLSPVYAAALDTIPDWRDYPTKRDADAARWAQRLGEVAARRAAGKDWPRHNKTEDQDERTLGVWLHTQRIDARAGKLTAAKKKQLNDVIPGWREGRVRRGRNSLLP